MWNKLPACKNVAIVVAWHS